MTARLANPSHGRYLGALKLNPNESWGRRSSAVEHPLRKRVVGGSNPSAGTTLLQSKIGLERTEAYFRAIGRRGNGIGEGHSDAVESRGYTGVTFERAAIS